MITITKKKKLKESANYIKKKFFFTNSSQFKNQNSECNYHRIKKNKQQKDSVPTFCKFLKNNDNFETILIFKEKLH